MARMRNQTQPPAPEVDFEAALPSQQNDDDLKVAMRTLRSGKPIPTSYPIKEKPAKPARRPKGTKKAKPSTSIQRLKGAKRQPQAQPKTPNSPYIYNNINNINKSIDSKSNNDCSEVLNKRDDIDIKAAFTEKELKFLKLYLLGDVTQEMAMIYAGYKATQPRYVRFLAKKIIQKYESQGGDHQKIFREIGFGEVEIAMGIKNLAQNAKSEMVRLNALALAAKCLGLTKEQVEGVGGITIIFEVADQPAALPGAPPALPVGEPRPAASLPGPIKPLQITR
jgi:hypothetical protein